MATYYELLRHPLWQKKRLEILQRADFSCENCGSAEKTLNVHHSFYEKGLKPWEYPNESLHCLCEDCHASAQDTMAKIQRALGQLDQGDTERALGMLLALTPTMVDGEPTVPIEVPSYEVAEGIAIALCVPTAWVVDSILDGVIGVERVSELLDRAALTRRVKGGR